MKTPEEVVKATEQVATTFSFPKLARLYLEKLPKAKCFYPREHTTEWPVLKELYMSDCGKMSAFDLITIPEKQGDSQFEKVISKLKSMSITSQDVIKIVRLYDGHVPQHLFRSLESLTIIQFHGEATTFPSKFLSIIHNQLTWFEVFNCSFEEIFSYEGEVIDHANSDVLLPQLTVLQLKKLPELKHICDKDQYIPVLDKLGYLVVKECPLLTNLVPPSVSFKKLTSLTVKDCGGLISLIQPSTATSLENLQFLNISRCERIEEIIGEVKDDDQESSSFGHKIIFNNLLWLKLKDLPRLINFSSSRSYTFNFPVLERVDVRDCPDMRTFCGGIITTPILENVCLNASWTEERWEGELNTTIEQIHADKEAKRRAITIPSTSSNNHFDTEAQAHENSPDGVSDPTMEAQTRHNATNIVDKGKGKEVDVSKHVMEHSEKTQETPFSSDPSCSNYAAQGQTLDAYLGPSQHVGTSSSQLSPEISNPLDEASPLAIEGEVKALSASTISPDNQIEEKFHDKPTGVLLEPKKEALICKNGATGGELVNEDQVCDYNTKQGKEMELCGNTTEPIKGSEIGEKVTGEEKEVDIKPVKLTATCGKVEEQTIAVSQVSRDVGASSSNSQEKDIQELNVTKHFIPLMSKVLEILQTRPLNSMSYQHIQFMEEASRDLSAMNFPMEWLCPYVDKAKKCLSVVDRTKAISEAELKIDEVEAQLQALKKSKRSLEETKKALEEENKVIALSFDLDKPLYED